MSNLLQTKDRNWRKRPNGASPVFDPGLSALGTDDEAGGARAADASVETTPGAKPMAATPASSSKGPRLTYPVWFGAAALLIVVIAVAAAFSFL